MGNVQAAEMAAAVQQHDIDLRRAISWHLTSNHYPPLGEYSDLLFDVVTRVNDGDLGLADMISLGHDTYRMLPRNADRNVDDSEWQVMVADFIDATHAWNFLNEGE